MLDLKQFCADEDARAELSEPFSAGEHSYATDGIVLVQVPRRPDVPPGGPVLDKLLPGLLEAWARGSFAPLPKYEVLPGRPPKQCSVCGGIGRVMSCEDCSGSGSTECSKCGHENDCSTCNGEGVTRAESEGQADTDCDNCNASGSDLFDRGEPGIARFETHDFNLKYIERIASLPGLTVAFGSAAAQSADPSSALAFYFTGGRGVLMAIRRSHLSLEPA